MHLTIFQKTEKESRSVSPFRREEFGLRSKMCKSLEARWKSRALIINSPKLNLSQLQSLQDFHSVVGADLKLSGYGEFTARVTGDLP